MVQFNCVFKCTFVTYNSNGNILCFYTRVCIYLFSTMQSIQQTDFDAFSAKLACISKGYLPTDKQSLIKPIDNWDQFYRNYKLLYFEYLNSIKVSTSNGKRLFSRIKRSIQSSQPVMNYGTYLRTLSIDIPLLQYLNNIPFDKHCQIVNLGCGSDLRCLQILNNKDIFPQVTKYIDLDFKQSIELKQSILECISASSSSFVLNDLTWGGCYEAVSCDLNHLDNTLSILKSKLDIEIPTIFITECTLCYIKERESQNLIDSIRTTFDTGLWISYDPIGGVNKDDKFGIIMKENLLMSRNLDLPTLLIYNSKETYSNRWNRYKDVRIQNMWDFLQSNINPMELKRLQSLQFLDEFEELKIMQNHYVTMNAQW